MPVLGVSKYMYLKYVFAILILSNCIEEQLLLYEAIQKTVTFPKLKEYISVLFHFSSEMKEKQRLKTPCCTVEEGFCQVLKSILKKSYFKKSQI